VSKVATSAVCEMFERREGAASFNHNNPAHSRPTHALKSCSLCPLDHESCTQLLRSNIPQTALVATLDTYDFIFLSRMLYVLDAVDSKVRNLVTPCPFFGRKFCHISVTNASIAVCSRCSVGLTIDSNVRNLVLFWAQILSFFCHRCIRKIIFTPLE
jgi:hypothetical protein